MESLQSLPSLQAKGANWKAILFWGVIIGLTGFAVYQYQDGITTWLAHPTFTPPDWIQGLTLDKVVSFAKDYGFLITAGFAGVTAIYGLYQKYKSTQAALNLESVKQTTNTEVNTAWNVAEQYKTQAESYKQQATTLTQKLEGADPSAMVAKMETQANQIQKLQQTVNDQTRFISLIKSPTIAAQKANLEAEGYLVRKPVA